MGRARLELGAVKIPVGSEFVLASESHKAMLVSGGWLALHGKQYG